MSQPPNGLPLILLADDDQAVRDALQFALQLEGFQIHAHPNGPALLADPALPNARCLIIDERMEPLDGFATLAALRDRASPTPTILLTGRADEWLRARAKAAGVHLVLEKPLLQNTLLDGLRGVLQTS
jgi:FixJ family two-component response regulator